YGVIIPDAQKAGEDCWRRLAERKAKLDWRVRNDFRISLTEESTNTGWVYREVVTPPGALWIAGAGHIAQAVAPLAAQLDFAVTIFDDRPALVNHEFFPAETNLHSEIWEKLLAMPLPGTPAFGLIVTRGHRHDALVLKD